MLKNLKTADRSVKLHAVFEVLDGNIQCCLCSSEHLRCEGDRGLATGLKKLPRQYIANIIYTIVGKPFTDWIDARVNERHEKRAMENNLNIQMDPEIARIFQQSTAVSTMNGTSHNLMKVSPLSL